MKHPNSNNGAHQNRDSPVANCVNLAAAQCNPWQPIPRMHRASRKKTLQYHGSDPDTMLCCRAARTQRADRKPCSSKQKRNLPERVQDVTHSV